MSDERRVREEEQRWYLGVLLHALNQPLTAVASYVEAMGEVLGADARDEVREALQSAREETVRAVVIARELRAVLGGRADLDVGPVDLNAVLEELAPDLPGETGTRVRLELDRAAGAVRGDALTLRRAVLALVRSGAGRLAPNDETNGGGKPDLTTVLRTSATQGAVCAEVQLLAEVGGNAPARAGPAGREDPLWLLARSALADLGGELILVPEEPGSLRFQFSLATL